MPDSVCLRRNRFFGCTWVMTCGEWVDMMNWQLGKTSNNLSTIIRCHLGCRCRSISSMRTIPEPSSGFSETGFAIAIRLAMSPIIAIKISSPPESWFTVKRLSFFLTSIRSGLLRTVSFEKPGKKIFNALRTASNCTSGY